MNKKQLAIASYKDEITSIFIDFWIGQLPTIDQWIEFVEHGLTPTEYQLIELLVEGDRNETN